MPLFIFKTEQALTCSLDYPKNYFLVFPDFKRYLESDILQI